MLNSIEDLNRLPDIDLLNDDGITLENIQEQMIRDYQSKLKEETGKDVVLYPGNPKRLELNVVAGQIYQMYEYAAYLFRQNFIRYMEDDALWNWGANLGFHESNVSYAKVTLEFGMNEALGYDVTVPKGTRATAGDDIFFATDEECTIIAGEISTQVLATCTENGKTGNDYVEDQINIIADPVINVSYVKNIDTSSGGNDEYSGDELREKVYMFPSTFSTAGPVEAYIFFAKKYDQDIVSVNVVSDQENATVHLYLMLSNGRVPDTAYCQKVKSYLEDLKTFPDTDRIKVTPPEIVYYTLDATYYISSSDKENEKTIKESVQEAAELYVEKQYENLGYDINPDIFMGYARIAGAKRIVIASPAFSVLNDSQIAICKGINLKYGGLEDD